MEKDILNRTIRAGQTVAYPVHNKAGLGMSTAEVVQVSPGMLKLRTARSDGQLYTFNFTRIDRVVIAEGADV